MARAPAIALSTSGYKTHYQLPRARANRIRTYIFSNSLEQRILIPLSAYARSCRFNQFACNRDHGHAYDERDWRRYAILTIARELRGLGSGVGLDRNMYMLVAQSKLMADVPADWP